MELIAMVFTFRAFGWVVLASFGALIVLMTASVAWAQTLPEAGNQTLPLSVWLPSLAKMPVPLNLTQNRAWDDRPAWSPNGTKIAFTSDRAGSWALYVMNATGSGVRRLTAQLPPDGEGAAYFAGELKWSPDGTKIAYVVMRLVSGGRSAPLYDGWLYVVGVAGSQGPLVTPQVTPQVTEVAHVQGFPPGYPAENTIPFDWSPGGDRLVFADWSGSLFMTDVVGGHPRPLLLLGSEEQVIGVDWSPNGRRIAVVIWGSTEVAGAYVINADGTDRRLLPPRQDLITTGVAWSPDGLKLLHRSGFDAVWVTNAEGGDLHDVQKGLWSYMIAPVWSPDGGRLAFYGDLLEPHIPEATRVGLYVIGAEGNNLALLLPPLLGSFHHNVAWSPNGRLIAYAYSGAGSKSEIFVVEPVQ